MGGQPIEYILPASQSRPRPMSESCSADRQCSSARRRVCWFAHWALYHCIVLHCTVAQSRWAAPSKINVNSGSDCRHSKPTCFTLFRVNTVTHKRKTNWNLKAQSAFVFRENMTKYALALVDSQVAIFWANFQRSRGLSWSPSNYEELG